VQNFAELDNRRTSYGDLTNSRWPPSGVRHLGYSKKCVFGTLRTLRNLAIDARTKLGENNSGFELILLI